MTKDQVYKKYLKLLRAGKRKSVPRLIDLRAEGVSDRQIRKHFTGLTALEKIAFEDKPELFPEDHEVGKRGTSSDKIYKEYKKLREKLGRMPKMREIQEVLSIAPETIYKHFKSIKNLDKVCREKDPEIFSDIPLTHIRNKKRISRTNKDIKNYNRFFVTTAVTGCFVNEDCYASVKSWCKKNDAKLLILVSEDPAKPKSPTGEHYIDYNLVNDEDHIIMGDTSLNGKIHISTIKLSAKQIDATTGLDRLTQAGTFIYASPKQRLKPVPVSNTNYVHLLITTGAITDPDYRSDMYMSLRTAYLAEYDHVMGGHIVELDKKDRYHHRQVQFDENGSFIDIGTQYNSDGTTESVRPIAIQPGDWHTGSTDPMVSACIEDMCENLYPKNMFWHDFFDGVSINHHIEKDRIELALLAEKGLLSLEKEIVQLRDEMQKLSGWKVDHHNIVYSNHDDFLNRYLRAAKYADPSQSQNHRISLKLAGALLDGHHPLEYGVNDLMGFNETDKWTWLGLDEDCILAGIQMGVHGHLGANGSRSPAMVGLERIYKYSNTGHTHGSEILRGAWRAGTSTYLKLGYNKGPSSWSQSHIHTYSNGARQIIYTIEGKWHLDSKVKGYS